MRVIKYKKGYKYKLVGDYEHQTNIFADTIIDIEWVRLLPNGRLFIKDGYAWDGASGPAIDTSNIMRASLVHDSLYQLLSLGRLDNRWRDDADRELRSTCIQDGMFKLRAYWIYLAVRIFGKMAIRRGKKTYSAP